MKCVSVHFINGQNGIESVRVILTSTTDRLKVSVAQQRRSFSSFTCSICQGLTKCPHRSNPGWCPNLPGKVLLAYSLDVGLCVVCGHICVRAKHWVVAIETVWPAKTEMLTSGLCRKSLLFLPACESIIPTLASHQSMKEKKWRIL